MQAIHILVDRIKQKGAATLSTVSINRSFECFGLEDKYEPVKIKHETRIPEGVYKLGVRTFGGYHKRYTKKFPEFHQGMLEILNVEGFTDILIHIGNYHTNTSGCLVVGSDAVLSGTSAQVNNSTVSYSKFYNEVIEQAKAGLATIEYRDSDR